MSTELTTRPTADGTDAYNAAVILAGANQASAVLKVSKGVTLPGRVTALNVNSATTLALNTHFGPLLRYTGSASGFWTLPLLYTLGYTRTPGTTQELAAYYQRNFLGSLSITPSQYRGEVASQAAMIALSSAVTGDWCQRTDQSGAGTRGGQVFVLTGALYSSAVNWTALAMNLANRPNIAWGNVANAAGRTALSNAIVGDFCVQTDDGITRQLVVAGPGTDGNWITRTDANKPVNPAINITWNNQDPSTLPTRHQPGMLVLDGIGNDDWTAC